MPCTSRRTILRRGLSFSHADCSAAEFCRMWTISPLVYGLGFRVFGSFQAKEGCKKGSDRHKEAGISVCVRIRVVSARAPWVAGDHTQLEFCRRGGGCGGPVAPGRAEQQRGVCRHQLHRCASPVGHGWSQHPVVHAKCRTSIVLHISATAGGSVMHTVCNALTSTLPGKLRSAICGARANMVEER
jgi:hypothetical protein